MGSLALALALVLVAHVGSAHAFVDGMTVGGAMSIAAVVQALGSYFFFWTGVRDKRNFFLLLGNVCCCAGAMVWVVMLITEQGNPTWATFFGVVACGHVYAIYSQFNKYRRSGCGSDSDDDGEDDDEAPAEGPALRLQDAAPETKQARRRAKREPVMAS